MASDWEQRLNQWILDRVPKQNPIPGWIWPTVQLSAAVVCVAAAVSVSPAGGESLALFGEPFGEPCAFRLEYGFPGPNCGMTRSWVWTVRGQLHTGIAYNPAGATLLLWIVIGGILGALRLATGRYNRWRAPFWAWFGWAVVWCGPIWFGLWALRAGLGVNPLPP